MKYPRRIPSDLSLTTITEEPSSYSSTEIVVQPEVIVETSHPHGGGGAEGGGGGASSRYNVTTSNNNSKNVSISKKHTHNLRSSVSSVTSEVIINVVFLEITEIR